ncbi:conserved hypothetical protein [Candidatus Magnetomoraceae bacterium gMMP-15]
MIEAKDAAKNAAIYYQEITGKVKDFLSIEEVELDDKEEYWYITLGIIAEEGHDPFFRGTRPKYDEYKVFKISAINGKVKSMKIRLIK